jgi:divalent metal cation (Fe/Co/Zn/Cd) transporter
MDIKCVAFLPFKMNLSCLQDERERVARSETLAIQLSNIANMVLFAAKVYASVRSGSLTIIAYTLDSLLDLLSGFILWFTAFYMQTPNPCRYPIGKRRMQPLVSMTCFLLTSCI